MHGWTQVLRLPKVHTASEVHQRAWEAALLRCYIAAAANGARSSPTSRPTYPRVPHQTNPSFAVRLKPAASTLLSAWVLKWRRAGR
jgi:hypothetical protein